MPIDSLSRVADSTLLTRVIEASIKVYLNSRDMS